MSPDWQTANGDIRLYLGDCLTVLPSLEAGSVDAVVTDPPYGMGWDTDSTRFSGGVNRDQYGDGRNDWGDVAGDDVPFDPSPWLSFGKVALWGFNHFAQRVPAGTTLVWLKKYEHLFGSFLSDGELCWVKGGCGIYAKHFSFPTPVRIAEGGGKTLHPCQKPVEIMAWSLERAKVLEGESVLDPYMGSGTTGVACFRTNRRFVGIEREPQHFATAVKRLQYEIDRTPLVQSPAPAIQRSLLEPTP